MVPCSVVRRPWSLSGLMSRKGASAHQVTTAVGTPFHIRRHQTPSVVRTPASFAEQNVAGNLRSLMKQSLLSKR